MIFMASVTCMLKKKLGEINDFLFNKRIKLMSFLAVFFPLAGVYPVDILEDDPERHQEAALAYYATLREGMRPSAELFSLPTGEQVGGIFLVGRKLCKI